MLLLLGAIPTEDDKFNCPSPEGKVTFNRAKDMGHLFPTNTRILPPSWSVVYVCRIDERGHFVDCQFAPSVPLKGDDPKALDGLVERTLRSLRAEVPNQPCVSSTIVWTQFDGPFFEY